MRNVGHFFFTRFLRSLKDLLGVEWLIVAFADVFREVGREILLFQSETAVGHFAKVEHMEGLFTLGAS